MKFWSTLNTCKITSPLNSTLTGGVKKKLPRVRDARIARALRDKLNWSYTFRAEKGSKHEQTLAPRQSPSLSSGHFVDSINERATNSMCFSNFP